MKTSAIVAGNVTRNEDGLPWSAQYQDLYHTKSGALAQTQRVFLAGNQLPARWAGRERFVVLETGFGLGHNFLATWDTWRRDPQRSAQLHFISIEKHPLTRADLAGWHCNTPLPDLAQALVQAWPPLTPNLHRLSFDDDAVQLLLCLGDVLDWLPELDASVDAFYLDGFSPARNPQMWQPRLYKAMARLAAPDAHVATWSAAQAVREGLRSAGFEVQKAAGGGGKRDITLARYAPSFSPRPTPTRRATPANAPRHALIVGGGLAGCAAAWALAQQGWHSTVLDRQAEPAQETSGNPAGLFHGIVNAQDGAHARFNRSAAFEARRAVEHAIAYHGVRGSVAGLLRLQNHGLGDRLGDELGGTAEMQAVLTQLGLPADYVQALDAAAATSCAGLPLRQAAWFYPGGGWVQPAGLARSFLQRAGALVGSQQVQWLGRRSVDRLVRDGQTWQLLDAQGALLAHANTVVLANAADALRLLNQASWPIESVRGQITLLPSAAWREAGLPFPTCPIAGSGYLLPEVDGHALFGASSQSGDDDARVREEDHRHNTTQLEGLLGRPVAVDLRRASGRVGWRCMSIDRLPVIGAVPDEDACLARWDQARFVPRVPGLFVMTALGSRGITWAALGAQVLASCVSGAPMPVESSLLDAIDPARFVVRRQRGKVA